MSAEMWYFVHKNKFNLNISKNSLTLLLFNRLNALELYWIVCGDTFLIKIFILIKDLLTFNAPYFELYRNTCFQMSFSYDYSFIHYTIYYTVSFQFGSSFVFIPVYMKRFM